MNKLILLFVLFHVFTGINQQAFAVDSARSSSSSPINHSVNSADSSSFKYSDNLAKGTEDHAANFANKHKKDVSDTIMRTLFLSFKFKTPLSSTSTLFCTILLQKQTSVVVPSMNSQAPLTSVHLLDLHRKFRGSKLTGTAPAPDADAEQERLLKKKDSQDSPKRKRERQEGKGGKNSQSQSPAGAEEALEICEKDRVELRWERDWLQKELETCEKKVEELQDKLDEPEYLFAQQADNCTFGLNEEGKFYLESSDFLPVTEVFTDRPLQLEYPIPTSDWFPEEFNERFENSEDGWPNSAIALVDDDVSLGIYVSAFVTAYAREDGTFGYFLQQSESQAAVKSLKDLLPSDSTETTKDHCSLFIDDGTCTACQDVNTNNSGDMPKVSSGSVCGATYSDNDPGPSEFYTCWRDTSKDIYGHTNCDPSSGGDPNNCGTFCWTRSYHYNGGYYSCKPVGVDWACESDIGISNNYPRGTSSNINCGPPCQSIDNTYNCPSGTPGWSW